MKRTDWLYASLISGSWRSDRELRAKLKDEVGGNPSIESVQRLANRLHDVGLIEKRRGESSFGGMEYRMVLGLNITLEIEA